MKKLLIVSLAAMALLGACQNKTDVKKTEEVKTGNTEDQRQLEMTEGQANATILSNTNWQASKVYDKNNKDVTAENSNLMGLAKYDADSGRYEFFDPNTSGNLDDKGIFFFTNDGKHRILISETKNYQAIEEITKIKNDMFTYKKMGKDANGKDVEVFVEHVPYKDKKLTFTESAKALNNSTGTVVKDVDGDKILADTLWQGSVVLDVNKNDVTQYNRNFISLAKYDANTNKYEFFNPETGESRGDYGYFNVIDGNKLRAHVSIGDNKYGAVLEITELNNKKFTYQRTGKDKDGKDITVFVEHEPYTGKFKPEFTIK
ncbi:lipoprotein [Lysinibacillus sphaericus]|uniref:DUF4822 domain-containing protein n=1 Tax=Lysinibacillus sphaericus TaxID=1421 RepID=UPI0018CF592D|nr:DUF4822 domain-containing protein [Lysinibacillus sphaericus]MBG9454473.1 lipoprotein [Lysinibacillus sphaericus]MBG9476708.1 lipoprotein [Lysinibacillus sphaericus]MBG9592809.1 lipoprotein [Lysinibacillus sphaericus]